MNFADLHGQTAVIAGGSEGVGAAYALELAGRGMEVALIARKRGALEETAQLVRAAHPDREVLTMSVDLSAPEAADEIVSFTQGREVGMLIYNAGASSRTRDFLDNDLQYALDIAAVNAMTMMKLVHAYGGAMKLRRSGGIIVMGSFACFVGNPCLAAYSGSKAFSTMFCEALWHELRPYGVHVLSHILGVTDTPANSRNFPGTGGIGDKPEDIARQGLTALGHGPVLRATGGDDLARMLAAMDRERAIEQMYEMGAAFRA